MSGPLPVVGGREACPCGSGKRYKMCHGRETSQARGLVGRPFAGRVDETQWVGLREVVPAATAPLVVRGAEDRSVLLSTVLPMALPALVRSDGEVLLGVQVPGRSGDISRDLGGALEAALAAPPGTWVADFAPPGPRLQDLLTDAPIVVTLRDSFDYWLPADAPATDELTASLERANASILPTVALPGLVSAYWCDLRSRPSLRWVLPEDEEPLLDALARLAATGGLSLGPDTRFLGSFRAHGLLVPVWDLPPGSSPDLVTAPAVAFRARLDEVLIAPGPLTESERRARAGLRSRQLTLR